MGEQANRTNLKFSLLKAGQLTRRIPFTLLMVVILVAVAWWTNSYFQELTRAWMSRLGFAPRDLWLLRWWRLIFSALVTSGGITFWLALMMVAFTSGVAEVMSGTWRAVLAFWGVHLVTLVLEALIFTLPLHQLGFIQARGTFFSRDVGPSAGYMGSLGYIATFLPKPWRWVGFGAIIVYLIVAFFLPGRTGVSPALSLSDNLAHLLAFPLGWLTGSLVAKRRAV
jgi:hypothetical protein